MVDSDILILGTRTYSQLHGQDGIQVVSGWLKNWCINVFFFKKSFQSMNSYTGNW
jgi:hypothetical protein